MKLPIPKGRITSPYGKRTIAGRTEIHHGIDISSNNARQAVQCAYSGTVVRCGWSDTFGNRVWIKNDVGYYAVYPHLLEINPHLKEGDRITEGDYVGIMGNTGIILYNGKLVVNSKQIGAYIVPMPHGAHLHFELRVKPSTGAKSIEPVEVINGYKALLEDADPTVAKV